MAKNDYLVMGIKVSLDPRVVNDVKTLKLFRQILSVAQRTENEVIDNKDAMKAFGIFDLLDRLVGIDQSDRVLDELSDEDGYTSTEKLGEFIGALFEAISPKNSLSSQHSGRDTLQSCELTSSNITT